MMDDIPFRCMGYETWHNLANKLDPDSQHNGNNWKMLAEKLGYSMEDILNIESRHTTHGRNTVKLFEKYLQKIGSSVAEVKQALESMDRPDALSVLIDALPDIQMRYQAELNKERMKIEPSEHSYYCQSNGCTMSPHSSYISDPMSSHSYGHRHHPNMRLNVAPQHSMYNYPSSPTSTMSMTPQSDISMSSRSSRMQKEINTAIYQHNSTPSCSMSRPPRTLPGYMNSVTTNSLSSSMEVNHPDRSYSDVDMADGMVPHCREEPAPVPPTMYRGEHRFDLDSMNSRIQPNLVNPSDMNVASEEIVGTSHSPMPMQEDHVHHAQKRHYHHQISEEININQPVSEKQKLRHGDQNLTLNLPSAGKIKKGADFLSPSPTTPVTPLAKLQQFTNSGTYMPDKEYNTIMEEKNREEMLYKRTNNLDDIQNRNKNDMVMDREEFRDIFNFRNSGIKASNYLQNQHNRQHPTKEPPRTFPLIRAKLPEHTQPSCAEQIDDSSNLVKSQSMPTNMKPSEYRRAFWHIKVFVTYSGINKRHIQKVLTLCKCLEKNGFTCCMDMFDHKMDTENKTGWCDQRFQEADFILVCISPHYKQEVLEGEATGAENITDKLHTSYIYKLMENEFHDNNDQNRRFIPLVFDGALEDDIPDMMQNTLKYYWPKQYKDLFWFLTKPETRVKRETESPKSPQASHES